MALLKLEQVSRVVGCGCVELWSCGDVELSVVDESIHLHSPISECLIVNKVKFVCLL